MPVDADHMTVWEAVPDMLEETPLPFIRADLTRTRPDMRRPTGRLLSAARQRSLGKFRL